MQSVKKEKFANRWFVTRRMVWLRFKERYPGGSCCVMEWFSAPTTIMSQAKVHPRIKLKTIGSI